MYFGKYVGFAWFWVQWRFEVLHVTFCNKAFRLKFADNLVNFYGRGWKNGLCKFFILIGDGELSSGVPYVVPSILEYYIITYVSFIYNDIWVGSKGVNSFFLVDCRIVGRLSYCGSTVVLWVAEK